jgi:hypothetical protein
MLTLYIQFSFNVRHIDVAITIQTGWIFIRFSRENLYFEIKFYAEEESVDYAFSTAVDSSKLCRPYLKFLRNTAH